jgi:hypothetical protein
VDDAMLAEEDERLEHLDGEAPDEGRREAGKAVGLDELVEVDAEELGRDAEVVAEVKVLGHDDDTVPLVRVLARERERDGSASERAVQLDGRRRGDRPIFAGCRGS